VFIAFIIILIILMMEAVITSESQPISKRLYVAIWKKTVIFILAVRT
jgi:hypothetical protein